MQSVKILRTCAFLIFSLRKSFCGECEPSLAWLDRKTGTSSVWDKYEDVMEEVNCGEVNCKRRFVSICLFDFRGLGVPGKRCTDAGIEAEVEVLEQLIVNKERYVVIVLQGLMRQVKNAILKKQSCKSWKFDHGQSSGNEGDIYDHAICYNSEVLCRVAESIPVIESDEEWKGFLKNYEAMLRKGVMHEVPMAGSGRVFVLKFNNWDGNFVKVLSIDSPVPHHNDLYYYKIANNEFTDQRCYTKNDIYFKDLFLKKSLFELRYGHRHLSYDEDNCFYLIMGRLGVTSDYILKTNIHNLITEGDFQVFANCDGRFDKKSWELCRVHFRNGFELSDPRFFYHPTRDFEIKGSETFVYNSTNMDCRFVLSSEKCYYQRVKWRLDVFPCGGFYVVNCMKFIKSAAHSSFLFASKLRSITPENPDHIRPGPDPKTLSYKHKQALERLGYECGPGNIWVNRHCIPVTPEEVLNVNLGGSGREGTN